MNKKSIFPLKDCTAIILAGGKSTRMALDKKYLKIDGSFLIDRVISNTSDLFEKILISTSGEIGTGHNNIKTVRDIHPGHGPLSGIVSGLVNSSDTKNFIIAADIPEISTELLMEMYLFTDDYDIVIPRSSEKNLEPLFGFYSKNVIPLAEKNLHQGKNKIIELYKYTNLKIVRMKNTDWYFNINTGMDLSRYLSYLAKNRSTQHGI